MADLHDHLKPDWLNVSRETIERLKRFAELTVQWTSRINLISPGTIPDIWNRHILDSAQLYQFAQDGEIWADLGSGGGFPGMVMAILSRDAGAAWRVNFVESDQRKVAFLRKVAQELALEIALHPTRAELLRPLSAQTLTARALAPLPGLLNHVSRHLAPGGRAILPKGARAQEEIDLARQTWNFDLQTHPSRTDPDAQILIIENLRHV